MVLSIKTEQPLNHEVVRNGRILSIGGEVKFEAAVPLGGSKPSNVPF
jgi:hypothetical protein